jgi:AAA ATPase containing von Willebrand factor type A (vWA) domain
MANKKLLQEAIQAFANNEQDLAAKKMRKYFLEAAQEINKKLEEEMEEECDLSEAEESEEVEDEVIEEDINGGMDSGLTSEIQYTLDEEEEESEDVDVSAEDGEGEESIDFDAEESEGGEDVSLSGDEWESIKDAFSDLEAMFDRIDGDGDFEVDPEGDSMGDAEEEVDFDIDAGGEDEFADIGFGDEKVGEGYKMKPVSKPSNEAAKSKSPVAPNAKSPVDGVAPVKIKDGTVVTNDGDLLKNKDAETAKVEDMNNVMDSAKGMMKDAKKPKNTAEKSRSPLPKKRT